LQRADELRPLGRPARADDALLGLQHRGHRLPEHRLALRCDVDAAHAPVLGRGLAGMDPSTYDGPRGVNGPVVIAIDITCFTALETFMAQTELQIDAVEGSRPASGVDEVLLPGTPELRNRAAREATGIPLADSTVADLVALAARHGLAAPQPLG
jgi:LDH2 family malate/lactate/ureidoglycolate dehydrogenase